MPQHYTVRPLPGKTYKHKQSRYSDTPTLGMRMLINAPSNSGKTNLIVSMITEIYEDAWDAGIHVFSHSINIDDAWKPVKRFMESRGFDPVKYCHDHYDEAVLAEILAEQKAVIEYQKKKGHTQLFGLLIVLDDMLDDAKLMRHSKQLEILFVRARHLAISTIVSVQKYRVVMPVVRVNTSDEIVFKLRNAHDLQAWVEESSALADPNTIMEIYRRAISQPYGFLWLKKTAKDPNDIFHIGFNPGEKIEGTVNEHRADPRERHVDHVPEHRALQHSGGPRGRKQPALRH